MHVMPVGSAAQHAAAGVMDNASQQTAAVQQNAQHTAHRNMQLSHCCARQTLLHTTAAPDMISEVLKPSTIEPCQAHF
jgi:hypothetical protein